MVVGYARPVFASLVVVACDPLQRMLGSRKVALTGEGEQTVVARAAVVRRSPIACVAMLSPFLLLLLHFDHLERGAFFQSIPVVVHDVHARWSDKKVLTLAAKTK
jgi:hypothetical protein